MVPLVQIEELSRLRITGPLISTTPVIVVQEVADAHGVSYDPSFIRDPRYFHSLRTKLNETPGIRIPFTLSSERPEQEPENSSDYPYLARYLNKNCTWTRSSLLQGWNFLRRWHRQPPSTLEELPVGSPTPDSPRSYSPSLLYRLCIDSGISLDTGTTVEQMAQVLELRKMKSGVLRLHTLTLLHSKSLNDGALRNLLFHTPPPTPTPAPLYPVLEEEQGVLRNLTAMRKRVFPTSQVEAIALAASVYGLDLIGTLDPMFTYLELRDGDGVEVTDSRVRELWSKNPQLLRLEFSFNPAFPASYYSRPSLERMARQEGYGSEDLARSSPYQLLRESRITNTFYLWQRLPLTRTEIQTIPGIRNQTLFTLETLEETDERERLYYGSLEAGEPLFLTTFSEMELRLQGTQNFDDPFLGEKFHPRAISKLLLLASEMKFRGVEIQIIQIRKIQQIGNEKMRAFAQEYFRTRDTGVREVLDLLLRVAMTMRGWKGIGPYPISVCPPNLNELESDLQLNSLLGELEKRDQELRASNPRLSILSLPLLRYREGRYELGNSTQGLTIADRLQIVKDRKEVSSCIRMTSNWLASCVYKYMKIIGLPLPFRITDLEHIT